jgi:hypothetical protein
MTMIYRRRGDDRDGDGDGKECRANVCICVHFVCTGPVTDSTPLSQAPMLAHFIVHAKNGRWVACNAALEITPLG